MAIEIRELIIKTEVVSQPKADPELTNQFMRRFKYELMEECRRMIRHTKAKTTKTR